MSTEKFHEPNASHPATCPGCTNDDKKWGKPAIRWRPSVGEKIRLKMFHFYGQHGLSAWTHLEVVTLKEFCCVCKTTSSTEEKEVVIEYGIIETPIYWSEQYMVTTTSETKALEVMEWLANRGGVTVWGSLDLGTAGRTMFTPADKGSDAKPHWSMSFVETVTDPERLDIGYDQIRYDKPPKSEAKTWTYDRRHKEWYRRVPMKYVTTLSVQEPIEHAKA